MTDYGTIKIPREKYEKHNQRRKENGQEWGEYIDGQAPEVERLSIEDVRVAAKDGAQEAIEEKLQR